LINFVDQSQRANHYSRPPTCIADTVIDTIYEKYRRYFRQYSKSMADTTGSNSNTAILTTLTTAHVHIAQHAKRVQGHKVKH